MANDPIIKNAPVQRRGAELDTGELRMPKVPGIATRIEQVADLVLGFQTSLAEDERAAFSSLAASQVRVLYDPQTGRVHEFLTDLDTGDLERAKPHSPALVAATIFGFLTKELGIPPEYIDYRIHDPSSETPTPTYVHVDKQHLNMALPAYAAKGDSESQALKLQRGPIGNNALRLSWSIHKNQD